MSTYTAHCVEDHEAFILDVMLPQIASYAHASDSPTEVVVIAVWLALSTILQNAGLSRDTLLKGLDAARLDVHEAPEGLH